MPLHPGIERRGTFRGEMQTELAPSPQHVLGGARPLVSPQVLELARVQSRQNLHAKIARAARALKQPIDARAISARVALTQCGAEPGITPSHRAREHGEATGGQIT